MPKRYTEEGAKEVLSMGRTNAHVTLTFPEKVLTVSLSPAAARAVAGALVGYAHACDGQGAHLVEAMGTAGGLPTRVFDPSELFH